ncbi:hypothetical protein NPIL_174041 [Nephila pilipes]|uniref:Uncharacterized protein n=1 Tax=Nephila pilipes TaxID=299642 RepID=A0A8X6TEQ1_NEPPI|nr:hypothetical protein NPIL_174041 [Nephila pilipes]
MKRTLSRGDKDYEMDTHFVCVEELKRNHCKEYRSTQELHEGQELYAKEPNVHFPINSKATFDFDAHFEGIDFYFKFMGLIFGELLNFLHIKKWKPAENML